MADLVSLDVIDEPKDSPFKYNSVTDVDKKQPFG